MMSDKLQRSSSFHKFVKSVDVTPNIFVNNDPHSDDMTPPKFVIDISRAYSVPSTPTGQICAPRTTMGIEMNCEMRVKTTLSAKANMKSGMPKSLLTCNTNNRRVFSSKNEMKSAHPNTLMKGTLRKYFLYM